MSPAFKIFTGKSIAIKITFAPETPFSFLIPVYNQGHQFNTLNGLRIIYKSFRITGFYIIFQQISFWNGNQCSIIFIKNFHPVQQYMAGKP